MTARPRITIARATTATCFVGAAVGLIGRWPEIIDGFGCCRASCHCNHVLALVACALYLAGILAIVLRVDVVPRGLLYYGLLSLAALAYLGAVPVHPIAKRSADPHELCIVYLSLSGVASLVTAMVLWLWRRSWATARLNGHPA